jgi:hypothetical protein
MLIRTRSIARSALAAATAVVFVVVVPAATALADLSVTTDLGSVASGVQALAGTTVGKANNAWVYSGLNNAGTTVWGNGEHVYQFTLTESAFLYLTNVAEPDADGTFPDPNHDYVLLNTLTTFDSDNTAVSSTNPTPFSFAGKPEGTSLAVVTETMGATTAGSSANIGILRSAATNPKGLYAPGTYYLAVDGRSGSVNSHGTANQLPAGNFSAGLNVRYLDDVTAPAAASATLTPGGQISGSYSAGEVKWFAFAHDGGAFSVDTQGNTLSESGGDSFLALYDEAGALVKFNDDVGTGPSWSRIEVLAGELPTGTYYLGFTEYKAIANPAFDLSVYPGAVGASGTFVINGLVPEPSSVLALLAMTPLLTLRRRRR